MNIKNVHNYIDNFKHSCAQNSDAYNEKEMQQLLKYLTFLLGENVSLERYVQRLESMNKELISCLKNSENI